MRSNAALFRSFARIEESMMRAAMPRISKIDPPSPHVVQVQAQAKPSVSKVLTFKLSEVSIRSRTARS